MVKAVPFILGILLLLGAAFLYLYLTAPIPIGGFDNANEADRCAQFREYDEDGKVYSLGYGGRIRQLIHGCF